MYHIKTWVSRLLLPVFLLTLTACGAPTWQEQYDLGIRYLTEENYEEAVLAFTAAIEIDDRQPLAYIGRGDAYIGSDESEEAQTAALADYEKALELDDTLPEAWLGAADVYVRRGDIRKALSLLEQALEKAADASLIQNRMDELREQDPYIDLYTEDLFTAQEMTIGGVPFWEATGEHLASVYPNVKTHDTPEYDQTEYDAPYVYPSGMKYGNAVQLIKQYDGETRLAYNDWPGEIIPFTTELRGISSGASMTDVLHTLGLTDKAAQLIRENQYTWFSVADDGTIENLGFLDAFADTYRSAGINFSGDNFYLTVELHFLRDSEQLAWCEFLSQQN